jgi:hypothetical protein
MGQLRGKGMMVTAIFDCFIILHPLLFPTTFPHLAVIYSGQEFIRAQG